jgi:hypothetical protein
VCLLLLLQLLRPLLQAWYWDSKPALVRRLMRLVLDRIMLDSVHPSGEKYEEVSCGTCEVVDDMLHMYPQHEHMLKRCWLGSLPIIEQLHTHSVSVCVLGARQ